MHTLLRRYSAIAASLLLAATPHVASAQIWANWTSADAAGVYGTLGSTNVSYVGGYNAAFLPGTTNYWNPSAAYTQNGLTAPTNNSFIQIAAPVGGTIFFASPVVNPYISLISVGQGGVPVGYTFSAPFTVLSNNNSPNCAYWSCGSYNVTANTLKGEEFSGTLQFTGTFSSINVTTDKPEYWHGFTVGAESTSTVPEPSTYVLMAAGLAGIFGIGRRRRQSR